MTGFGMTHKWTLLSDGSLTVGIGIILVLAHAHVITIQAMALALVGCLLVYTTLIGNQIKFISMRISDIDKSAGKFRIHPLFCV
jgi:hypothetical protein